MSKFSETILLTTQNNLCPHIRAYIFAQWKKRPKAQFINVLTCNSNRDKFFKMIQFRTVPNEVNIILL